MERLINNSELNWGQGTVDWKEGDEFANICINVKGQDFEGREAAFWLELLDAPAEIHFGRKRSKVIVIKDDEPGSIGFAKPSYVFKEADHSALIPVLRANGTDGMVTVEYTSRDMTAIAGMVRMIKILKINLINGSLPQFLNDTRTFGSKVLLIALTITHCQCCPLPTPTVVNFFKNRFCQILLIKSKKSAF
jgi:hypothetical protein